MKYSITKTIIITTILLSIGMIGCKTKEKVVTKNHFVNSSTINHRSEVVTLGTHTRTIVNCKEVDQEVQVGDVKVLIKAIDSTDSFKVEIQTPEITQVKDSTNQQTQEIKTETVYEKVTVYKTPKWAWWLIIILLGLAAWGNRKLILKLFL